MFSVYFYYRSTETAVLFFSQKRTQNIKNTFTSKMKDTRKLQNFRLDIIGVLSLRRSDLYCRPCS